MAIAVFLVYLVPPSLLFLSLSRLVVAAGLQDSTWSLVLVYPTITIPVSVWLLIGFLKAIPRDVEEQAMVDGYSRGPGVGAIGMCFTGGFALAMAMEASVLAPVVSQPALPAPLGARKRAAVGLDDADLRRSRRGQGRGCACSGCASPPTGAAPASGSPRFAVS
jgi:hypothetical protein